MPQTPIAQFLLGLLGSLGLVLVVFACFAVAYRRHLRRLRLADRTLSPRVPFSLMREPISFSAPDRWLAIRSSNTAHLRGLFGLGSEPAASWSEALERAGEAMLFLSPPVEGWTLIIGGALPDPVEDIDRCYRLLVSLSKEMGEVQFFAADRILNHHAFARLRGGKVLRAYAWSGVAEWNEGRVSADERLLGIRSRDYGELTPESAYGEVSPEQINTERLFLLARRWSLDPMVASEMILEQERLASSDEDRDPPGSENV